MGLSLMGSDHRMLVVLWFFDVVCRIALIMAPSLSFASPLPIQNNRKG